MGFVIVTDKTPRLIDAAPKHLRRANEIDWPTLLRVMHRASKNAQSPIEAARHLCESLFSLQRIELGFSSSATRPVTRTGEAEAAFGLSPTRREIYNSKGRWEAWRQDRVTSAHFRAASLATKRGPIPPLSVFSFVAKHFSVGRVARLPANGNGQTPRYGRELAVAVRQDRSDKNSQYSLTRTVRAWLKRPKSHRFTFEALRTDVLPNLQDHLEGGAIADFRDHRGTATALIDFADVECPVYRDEAGSLLVDPRERHLSLDVDPNVTDASGFAHEAAPGTAAYAWRKLGLISPDGTPTLRGIIFSFFHHGDGLAIAAGLEDESYPLRELAVHFANIRGGYRFQEARNVESLGSERLAMVCRQTFGAVSHAGYLDLGLPVGYGEGTAEVILSVLKEPHTRRSLTGDSLLDEGDIERALVEWFSLLRHIVHAPEHDWSRWRELKHEAKEILAKYGSHNPTQRLVEFPAGELNRSFRHEIYLRNL